MKKIMLAMVVAALVSGCATNSDVENVQLQITALNMTVTQVAEDVKNALYKAKSAEASATLAAKYAQETNAKLDNMFKKVMSK
jgi:murein lipoprotein